MSETAAPSDGQKQSHRWWKIVLGAIVALLVIAVLGVVLFGRISVRRAFPDVDGEAAIAGLEAGVKVVRDDMGVAHIYAANPHDLFVAQGYVHAQERFWQMDVWRHIGSGRLSEMFGESQVETDTFLRTLGWHDVATAQLAAATPENREIMEAYSEGVNAYLATRSPSDLSFEYTILELSNHGYDPEPWDPVDTLTWGIAMAWDLRGNMDAEIERAMLLGSLSEEQVAQLFPPYPGEINPYIVPVGANASAPTASLRTTPGIRTALASVQTKLDLVAALGAGDPEVGIGSNSWVVSGNLTDTGSPILANDPHLAIQMPSIWYQNSLHCTEVSDACPFDVAGFSFAGVPGVIIGHNAKMAWGITNLGPDVQDLFIEKINPDNPNQYEVNGAWVDMDVHEETIDVAGGDPVTIEVKVTRHGPIISDVYGDLEEFTDSGIETPEPYAIALRWTALDTNPGIVETFMGLDTAANWDDFRTALRSFAVPSQNVVYADVEGNIGYQSPGRIPIRANGDGTLPVPGWTDEYEWTGYIPFDELPRSFNPESGYIVTANNAVVGDDYPHMLTYDWNFGYRARRIVDLVGSNAGIGLAEYASIQFDSYSLNAEQVIPYLASVTSPINDVLASWDLGNYAGSSGAAAFNAVWSRIMEFTFHDDLPEDYWPNGAGRWFFVVGQMLEDPDDPFWDDRTTTETEDRDAILQRSMDAAHGDLTEWFGDDPDGWRWGEMHLSTFRNQTLGESGIGFIDDRFNRGPFETTGGSDLVNATGWTAYEGFETTWLPSMRMLVDLGDLSRSLTTHTTGQSGHTDHAHYDDMIPLWLAGEYSPMNWTRNQIDAAAESVQTLVPTS
ncbi:MAG: penicillin acylase family protein [Actinomycetota bacterium]|nr:penicillin acylase family protein [Actinomycetota bacterium]